MTEKQTKIYEGLKAIGPEIAQFYFDGLKLVDSDFGTKSNLLAHTLREIDGGLRDIFEPKHLKKDFQDKLKKEDLEKIFDQFKEEYKEFDYLRDITFDEFKDAKGHISSILLSFGLNVDHPLSAQYIKAVRWLAKYAHRSGAFNEPRNPKDIINLWNEFEDVLSKLIGSYYALADRIDSIIKLEEPSPEILKTLPNLLNTPVRTTYFFNRLKSRKWLLQLEQEGYFDGSKNPDLVESVDSPGYYSIPYWSELTYLETVAEENLKSPEDETTKSLVRIINNISSFRNEKGQRIENYRTDYIIFKIICSLPKEYLNESHFLFISDALQSNRHGLIGHSFNEFLDRLLLLEDKVLLSQGIEILLMHRVQEDIFDKVYSIFRDYELQRIISECKDKIASIFGLELQKLIIQKMKEVIKLDKSIFNSISIPAIEDHEQTYFEEKYDYQLVYLLRDTLEKLDAKDIIDTIEELLNEEHPIFHRIAFHIIRIKYSELRELFWKMEKNPLDLPFTKHEVYELLHQHSTNFSSEEIQKVIEWINTKEYYIPEDFKDDEARVARLIAYKKKEWLTSLLPNGSEDVKRLIAEMNEINDAEIEHPGFDSWHSSQIGTISPLSIEELEELSIKEIIAYYDDFNKQQHSFMGPSVEGLIDILILSVRNNPQKYNVNCNEFLNAPPAILYAWIRGLEESWRDDKKEFECDEILNTVCQILESEEFWDSHNSDGEYNRWFVSNLISFINHGTRDDKHAFNFKLLPLIKKILFIILDKDLSSVFDYHDLSMTVLNNSKGKVYDALFQYSLRLARVENKENERWDNEVKELIVKEIEKEEDNPLLFHVIGQFLSNIQYLDENWLIKNFNKLFPITFETNWSASVNGYFYYHRRLSKIFFKLFIEGGHFQKILSGNLIQGEPLNNIIRQICIAYLYDFEDADLESKIVQLLIKSKNEDIISSLIYFFWNPQDTFENGVINKIKPFWIEIFNNASKLENEKIDRDILSGSCKWLKHIDKIDEELYEVLLNSMKYLNQSDRYFVIEILSKHIENSPKEVGTILLELFKTEVAYDISRGNINKVVEILYEKNFKDIADQICLLHGEKGFDFLRELYIKYNP
ncbi:hypothetical protein [Elizabethkingia anophelis]|uniref:hypothetical protein n=1 Tax=Elizabethkingia anophelis TaxID=1117645 RepID=UPI0024692533|nr:hypothetical protein [Elizabethkingia anophelis]WGL69892.1 hypothetical protein QFB79_00705 [Elizabethkingia anophelis]